MVIEKVHGLQATSISLSERFTMLASSTPVLMVAKRRPSRPTIGSFLNQDLNIQNRALIEQIARKLQQQAKRRALRQRLGQLQPPGLRRYGSEGNLQGVHHYNSFGNLNARNRKHWRPNNANMGRSASFNNLSAVGGRGGVGGRAWYQRRGGRGGRLRTRMRGGGGAGGGGRGGRVRGRGTAAARMSRLQARLAAPSREQLDEQLARYMAGSRQALDKQLDEYMRAATALDDGISDVAV